MTIFNERIAADAIAVSLFRDLKSKRLMKIGIDEVRAAVVGFNSCLLQFDRPMTMQQTEDLENLTLRKSL